MRNCFILSSVITASAVALSAGSTPDQGSVMLVVRSDARTGRLVRSVVRPGHPTSDKAGPQIEWPIELAEAPPALVRMVDAIAERHAVDRDLVHSMIRVESNYNPLAVSDKGALGLMQLIPSTARRFGVLDSFNPAQNVEGGVLYLKYLLDHYNGNQRMALAAYNAGEGTVERFGGVPPFAETRSYVKRVGKELDQTKAKQQHKTEISAKPAEEFNPIRQFMDVMGRTYYKTP